MSDKSKRKSAEPAPVKIVRRGAIAASIWQRQAPSGFEYYDFTLSRSWKSKNSGKQGYSSNFFCHNANELAEVVEEASKWIESQETSTRPASNGANTHDPTAEFMANS